MFNVNDYDVVGKAMKRCEKENYIADMLVRTLCSNKVDNDECYRIIKLFEEKVLNYDQVKKLQESSQLPISIYLESIAESLNKIANNVS